MSPERLRIVYLLDWFLTGDRKKKSDAQKGKLLKAAEEDARLERERALREAVADLIGKLPARLRDQPGVAALRSQMTFQPIDIVHLIYRDKAYAQIQLGKYNDAIITLDKGLSRYPNDAMLWNNKGYALYLQGKQQDALMAYTTATSYDGNYTNAYINQGDVLSEMGRYAEAVKAYTRANETDPFNIAASDGLAAARKGEAQSTGNMTILLVIVAYKKGEKPG